MPEHTPITFAHECRTCKHRHQYDGFAQGARVRATNDRRGVRVTLAGDVGTVVGQSDINVDSQLQYLVEFDSGGRGVMAPCELEEV